MAQQVHGGERNSGTPRISATPEALQECEVTLDRCRSCSDCFSYNYQGWSVNIIVGIPKAEKYKAASYVWGTTKPVPFRCLRCGVTTHAPMESVRRFRRLMGLTDSPGESLWLDALSIDQSDPKDIASQIAVMGDIYSKATSVAVLLPERDGEAFELLEKIGDVASIINRHADEFSGRHDNSSNTERLSNACQQFFALVDNFEGNLHKYVYWSRAWTFQEWALAQNISLAWEGSESMVNLSNMKSCILNAAVLMSVYKVKMHQYASISLGFSRGMVPRRLETVKRIFPDERGFVPLDMIDEKKVQFGALMPSMGFDSLLGLRAAACGPANDSIPIHMSYKLDLPLPAWSTVRQRQRLYMVLNALGVTKREARFEADLIASWASMCNIRYEYKKDDTFGMALQKVLKALRQDLGLTVYNFLANTSGSSAEVDLKFLEYAQAHKQCNATNEGFFHGTPVFTGRADTAIHLRNAVSQPLDRPLLKGTGVPLRRVLRSSLTSKTSLTDIPAVLNAFQPTLSGSADESTFVHVLNLVADVLTKAPKEQIEQHVAVISQFRLSGGGACRDGDISCWAICPADTDLSGCFVARESLNGTLVLAKSLQDGNCVVLAYLTITDQQSGTHLIKVNERGEMSMIFRTPMRGDLINSNIIDERSMEGIIELEEKSILAF
ncbi:heterokaryon incompatibility protein-domain-containing protein [Paraphoma chrysanthemicola]|uniref:Heterokaryon incompatibility protein-domain-containing protein n=1 Tax=Paraphoma chrysanthemicola TaxID=798071 RepID=A0A8K0VS08_9PLEO|nr:heterokaryon incompatibility protein-domain-containing protein [Paraphoma chrysanthemicola]